MTMTMTDWTGRPHDVWYRKVGGQSTAVVLIIDRLERDEDCVSWSRD